MNRYMVHVHRKGDLSGKHILLGPFDMVTAHELAEEYRKKYGKTGGGAEVLWLDTDRARIVEVMHWQMYGEWNNQ